MSILQPITEKRNSITFIILISLLISINAYGQKTEKGVIEQTHYNPLIQADTTIEKNYIVIFDEFTEEKTTLTDRELKIVNQNLIEAVNSYNKSLKVEINKWNKKNKDDKRNFKEEKIDLRYYFRQYFVSTNQKSEKIIRVYCFCMSFGDSWKSKKYEMFDGGDCILHITVNITKNKHSKLTINGVA